MISERTQTKVLRLLAGGLSQRKTAKATGVNRGSVGTINRRGYVRRITRELAEALPRPSGLPRHCPTCGGMVHMPCQECFTPRPRRPYPAHLPGDLALDLRGDCLKRYKKLRAWHLQQIKEHGLDRHVWETYPGLVGGVKSGRN